jgi:hypothetical protein
VIAQLTLGLGARQQRLGRQEVRLATARVTGPQICLAALEKERCGTVLLDERRVLRWTW